jgi:metal-responsive CopG/Arc/MetJ family transcriptional regulator
MSELQKKEKVVFGINMDKELKKKLKAYCVENDITLTEAIEEAIKEYLQKRGAL